MSRRVAAILMMTALLFAGWNRGSIGLRIVVSPNAPVSSEEDERPHGHETASRAYELESSSDRHHRPNLPGPAEAALALQLAPRRLGAPKVPVPTSFVPPQPRRQC